MAAYCHKAFLSKISKDCSMASAFAKRPGVAVDNVKAFLYAARQAYDDNDEGFEVSN